ncbi:MAG: transposase [Anaerolineae bacterium]|nr:transposase [Anaerolineae bacterium]MBL8104010.1 transposase [Anaerolineales bacterium]MCC7190775.1 transposase [Anaerolineales bacterium]
MKWSTSPHRPPHLYLDDAWYFVTASTVGKAHILSSDAHFNLWIKTFNALIAEFNAKLMAWVILANHYHFLFLPQHGLDLGKFMKRLNGSTAFQLNGLDNTRGRTVWYTYWDTCIRGERDFWTRFNYIHYNPVKHGYVQQPEGWLFSSYRQHISDNGEVWMKECAQEFPVLTLFDDDNY